jgi:hypothetical protein
MKSENITFTLECTMKERWVPHFLSMLAYMEQLGGLGCSRKVALYSDGDGDFRPKFKVEGGNSISIRNIKVVEPKVDNDGDRLYDAG